MIGRTLRERAIFNTWPNWVSDLRRDGYRVPTVAAAEKMGLPRTCMHRINRSYFSGKGTVRVVTYYEFTADKAPVRYHVEVWVAR